VVTLSRAGHPLPYTITGLAPGHLHPNRCIALAAWLHRHTGDYLPRTTTETAGQSLFTISYATRWLLWTAQHGGIHVARADGPDQQDRRRRPGPPPGPAPAAPPPATIALIGAAASAHIAQPADRRWREILTAMRTAGPPDDVAATARMVLAVIDDGDPLVLDTLPRLHAPDPTAAAAIYRDAVTDDATGWDTLDSGQRQEAIDAYHHAFDQSTEDRAPWHCHNATGPSVA
jgi:hypothetical protein